MKTNCARDYRDMIAYRGHYPVWVYLNNQGEIDIEYHNVDQISPKQHADCVHRITYAHCRDELPTLSELRAGVRDYKKIQEKISGGMSPKYARQEVELENIFVPPRHSWRGAWKKE